MHQIQMINSNGYVHGYVNGETREAAVDALRARFSYADGWKLTPKIYRDSPKDIKDIPFWKISKDHGNYQSGYELWIYEVDSKGKRIETN